MSAWSDFAPKPRKPVTPLTAGDLKRQRQDGERTRTRVEELQREQERLVYGYLGVGQDRHQLVCNHIIAMAKTMESTGYNGSELDGVLDCIERQISKCRNAETASNEYGSWYNIGQMFIRIAAVCLLAHKDMRLPLSEFGDEREYNPDHWDCDHCGTRVDRGTTHICRS